MKKHNQDGAVDVLLVPLVLACLLLIGAIVFGYWAYGGRQDYKDNVDQKIAAAVSVAKQQESQQKDKEFAEAEKQPLKAYAGPESYGSLIVNYPKTWSSYVDSSGNGDALVDGYFDPGTVPAIGDQNNNFALRIQVLSDSYSDVLAALTNQQGLTITPYSLPKVPKVVGVRLEGQISTNKSGSMVILPLRSNTLEISTEAQQYEADFDNNILPNLSFSP